MLLNIRTKCRYISWEELQEGQEIHYLIPNHGNTTYGPFVVVDPFRRVIRNLQGVEVSLPNVHPIIPIARDSSMSQSPKIEVTGITCLHEGKYPEGDANARTWLRLMRTDYTFNGKPRHWWWASRNGIPGVRADAVVIVALVRESPSSPIYRLLVTDESRIPLAQGVGAVGEEVREYGFPAGLIEDGDGSLEERVAAELQEETGLTVVKIHKNLTSKGNLISSAGLSNESVTIVFIEAQGTPSRAYLEDGEDINARLLDFDQVMALLDTPGLNISAKAWGLMMGWKFAGKLTFDTPRRVRVVAKGGETI